MQCLPEERQSITDASRGLDAGGEIFDVEMIPKGLFPSALGQTLRVEEANMKTLYRGNIQRLALLLCFGIGNTVLAGQIHFTRIDVSGARITRAFAINTSGEIVGTFFASDRPGPHAFHLDRGELTAFDVPGATLTNASGINPQGEIVGFYTDAAGINHGYRLMQGQFQTIDLPGATATFAKGINTMGEIVGRFVTPDNTSHGFLLNPAGAFTTIDVPGATYTEPSGINPQGEVVGIYRAVDGTLHGFLLSHGTFSDIDVPGAGGTGSPGGKLDISPEGTIVGYYNGSDKRNHAFVYSDQHFTYSDQHFTSFDVPASRDTCFFGISAQGDIVGFYTDVNGVQHGLLVRPQERRNTSDGVATAHERRRP